MNLSMDYDDTFTRDPEFWLRFAQMAQARGYRVYGVTMRYPGEASGMDSRYDQACDAGITFTGRKAKREFMYSKDIRIDVWIDDEPLWIIKDAIS